MDIWYFYPHQQFFSVSASKSWIIKKRTDTKTTVFYQKQPAGCFRGLWIFLKTAKEKLKNPKTTRGLISEYFNRSRWSQVSRKFSFNHWFDLNVFFLVFYCDVLLPVDLDLFVLKSQNKVLFTKFFFSKNNFFLLKNP